MALYDAIGAPYDAHRRADPTIAKLLWDCAGLGSGVRVVDVGCGTGNDTLALQARGAAMTGVDPSDLMLQAARKKSACVQWVKAKAEALPFEDASFGGLISVNALLHMADRAQAFKEFARVLVPGGRIAVFGNTSEDIRRMWLTEYVPQAMEAGTGDSVSADDYHALGLEAGLIVEGRTPWAQPAQAVDCFLHGGKRNANYYRHPPIRAGISTFTKYGLDDEIAAGLDRLAADIAMGTIARHTKVPDHPEGDYSVFVYLKEA